MIEAISDTSSECGKFLRNEEQNFGSGSHVVKALEEKTVDPTSWEGPVVMQRLYLPAEPFLEMALFINVTDHRQTYDNDEIKRIKICEY
uniref:Uncharacterized protein n=1 Tax=Romanomermis culicivorax TaxID=13658 RepID=A0A915IJQ8_ROMCU